MSKGTSGGGDPDLDDDTTKKRQGVNKFLRVDIIKGKPSADEINQINRWLFRRVYGDCRSR
jgi:hypothetical protein